MSKGRLEAFSDGVIAILITIMVLELKEPHSATFSALRPLVPILLSYLLSFVFLGIYWNNHHHMLHAAEKVTGGILWANLHLLFWLSLIPWVTAWLGQNPRASAPAAAYGVVMLGSGIAYYILEQGIVSAHGPDSKLARAVKNTFKERLSTAFYAAAIPLAYVHPWISDGIFVVVAAMWLVPDRRIEHELRTD
jgi:uncharacterized membrane protein